MLSRTTKNSVSMTKPGGPANINGILYQALQSLGWVARFTLSGTGEGTLLIAEPKGGDLEVRYPFQRTISQFKASDKVGTWSLTELIDQVLPDLYLAVDTKNAQKASYVFVTEGRIGSWTRAYEFFRSLASRPFTLESPTATLDASRSIKFARGYSTTERALFSRILDTVRARATVRDEDALVSEQKLWHLLANFSIEEQRSADDVKRELRQMIRACGAGNDEVEEKKMSLVGFLLNRAKEGSSSFEPSELIAEAGLSTLPITDLPRVAAAARANLAEDLRVRGYSAALSVRSPLALPDSASRICLVGDSGQGKTWAMAAIAERLAGAADHCVMMVRATGDPDRDLADAAAKLSRDVLGRRGPHDLRDLINDLEDLLPHTDEPRFTICVDGVRSAAEAQALVDPTQRLNAVRIVFTGSRVVAKALSGAANFSVVSVTDFNPSELQRFLAGHGWEEAEVPADIRRVIRRPLLAKLFTEIAGEGIWRPTSEYQLYERYWNQRLAEGDQAEFPGDRVSLGSLALAAATGEVSYPWTVESLRVHGLDDFVRRRLESIGLLRREGSSEAAIWHDRLLSWATAEALVEAVRTKRMTTDAFSDVLVALSEGGPSRRFGYAPMDALWLAAGNASFSPSELLRVLEALEQPDAFGEGSLYALLVPTLGARILPALEARIQKLQPEDHHLAGVFARGLTRIAETTPVHEEVLVRMLEVSNPRIQDVALAFLANQPRPVFLDRIWTIHAARESLEPIEHSLSYKRTFAALIAAAREDPYWLEKQIGSDPKANEPVWDLAYALAALSSPQGAAIWHRQKERLFRTIRPGKQRSLIRCIHLYRDSAELSRLERWLEEPSDLANVAAFAAIANIDPGRAVLRLKDVRTADLMIARSWWLPWLLRARPEKGKEAIRRRIESNPDETTWAAEVYEGSERAMDLGTLEYLLDWLDRQIQDFLVSPSSRSIPFRRILALLAKCNSRAQIEHLETRSGSNLEIGLASLAINLDELGYHEHELADIVTLLSRFGGDGYVTFVRVRLNRIGPDDYVSAFDVGYPCAGDVGGETSTTIARLNTESSPKVSSLIYAATRLAAAGGDVNTVLEVAAGTPRSIEVSVPQILADFPPAGKEVTERMISRLELADANARLRAAVALGLTGRSEALRPLTETARRAAFVDVDLEYAAAQAAAALIRRGVAADVEAFDFPSTTGAKIGPLRAIGSPEAIDRIERYVYESQNQGSDVLDTAVTLLGDEGRAEKAARWMWPRLQNLSFAWWHPSWDRVFQYLSSAETLDFLISIATDETRPDRIRAIKALRFADPARALEIAERAVRDHVQGHADLLPMLLERDQNRSVDLIFQHLETERDEFCRMAASRALRKVVGLRERLADMLRSASAGVREAACEIAGWQPESANRTDLGRLAFEDPVTDVQLRAVEALQRQDDLLESETLSELLKASAGRRAWVYAEALVDVADPLLLNDRSEGICIWNSLSGHAQSLRIAVEKRLEKRWKSVQEDARRRRQERESEN